MWQQLVNSKDQFLNVVGIGNSGKRRRRLFDNNKSLSASTKRQQIPPCSDLYDLVLAFRWEQVIRHCQEHPQDAQFQEGDGLETPLYLACQWNPPIEVIQALIRAYPEALQTTTREHRDLPVHCICRYASTTVEMLNEFVHRFPSTVVHPTKHGKTALQVLWGHARPDCLKEQNNDNNLANNDEEQLELDDFWNKMELLVKAVAIHRQQSWPSFAERELHLVHATVSLGALGVPLEVLEYICDKYPQQLRQRDGSGRLPLHLAVGPTLWSPSSKRKYKPREQEIIQVLLQRYPEAARIRFYSLWDYYDTETMNTNLKADSSSGRSSVSSPNASNTNTAMSIDRSGRYPLHMAVANRHTWDGGAREVFLAAPEILSVRDPVTKLYPFQLAAIPVGDTMVVSATTIWELLRLQPDLVEDGCSAIDPAESRDSTARTTRSLDPRRSSRRMDAFTHNGYLSHHRHHHQHRSQPRTTSSSGSDCSFYAQSKQPSSLYYSSRHEDNNTLYFGLGVAVAVGAGFWCLAQQGALLPRSRSQTSLSGMSS